MAANDDFRAGESMAIDWIAGRSQMSDDLAFLVSEMDRPLDETARGFLITIGNAARAAAKRAEQAAKAQATAAAHGEAQPAATVAAALDVDASWRRMRELQRRARLEELWRRNSQVPFGYGAPDSFGAGNRRNIGER